jgi:undecaprenyl-diphosphatase
VAVGLFFKDRIEEAFSNPLLAAYLLLATGIILLLSRLGLKSTGQVTLRRSILIGLAQALAILPGISRSGTTISTGMLLGVEREASARFSFLLAIPAIAGAFVLQIKDILPRRLLRPSWLPWLWASSFPTYRDCSPSNF